MKVEIRISSDIQEPYAILCTPDLTPEIKQLAKTLENKTEYWVTGKMDEKTFVLEPASIQLIRTEGDQVVVYGPEQTRYISGKRLYEIENQLGPNFVRISKSAIVNLRQISHVAPVFSGSMQLVLKNGCEEAISRRYYAEFKKQLGL